MKEFRLSVVGQPDFTVSLSMYALYGGQFEECN